MEGRGEREREDVNYNNYGAVVDACVLQITSMCVVKQLQSCLTMEIYTPQYSLQICIPCL